MRAPSEAELSPGTGFAAQSFIAGPVCVLGVDAHAKPAPLEKRCFASMPVFRLGQTWDAFRDLEREVDRLFRGVNLTFQGIRFGRQFPAINVYELDDEFLLTAELPGTRSEDLEITIAGGVLRIKGRRGEQEGASEDRYRRQERFRGEWERSLTIPERVREEDLSADFTHGILRIHLPKAAAVKPRQIRVAEGSE